MDIKLNFDERLPPGGVKELIRTPSGRAYLDKLRARHKTSLFQPGTKEFDNLYGDKLRQGAKLKEAQERQAKDEWQKIADENRLSRFKNR